MYKRLVAQKSPANSPGKNATRLVEKTNNVDYSNFENISLGNNRPSQIVRQYADLYCEDRIEAFDALTDLQELSTLDDLKAKLLFSIVVLSFRSAQQSLQELRGRLRHLLCLPIPDVSKVTPDAASVEMEKQIDVYLRRTHHRFDVTTNAEEVCSQICATLFEYPSLKSCRSLRKYVHECVQIAWALSVQMEPYVIRYDSLVFDEKLHTRYHTSNGASNQIRGFVWPCLFEGEEGACVHKGVVIT